jgi:DNA-nicking Smr family endonuclease
MDSDKKSYFQEAMKGVTPLRASKKMNLNKTPTQPLSKPKKNKQKNTITQSAIKPATQPRVFHTKLSPPWDISNIQAETCLSFGKVRIQAKQFKKLKQGNIRPEAQLDLHGLYLDAAETALLEFIQTAKKNQNRCILIIHGKGGRFHEPPVLKAHVNHWLKQLPEVLAFHSAIPRDGGCGAVYVAL